MRVTLSFALIPCLACYRPHVQVDDSLRQGTLAQCVHVVEKQDYSLCFVSGGKNPKKPGDKDHYDDAAWKAVQTGGAYHAAMREMDCAYCPAIGYWPPFAEKSIMIYCPNKESMKEELLLHCVKSGVALFQDAVLYRSDSRDVVKVISTYKENEVLTPEGIDEGKVDTLITGAFGEPARSEFEEMGTGFTRKEAAGGDLKAAVVKDTLFAFTADFMSKSFCRQCISRPAGGFMHSICLMPGTGVENAAGLPCDEMCSPCKATRQHPSPQQQCCAKEFTTRQHEIMEKYKTK